MIELFCRSFLNFCCYKGTNPTVKGEKGYPFGKLRLSEDGKKEELVLVNPS